LKLFFSILLIFNNMPRNIPVTYDYWYLSVEPLAVLSQTFILLLMVINSPFPYESAQT